MEMEFFVPPGRGDTLVRVLGRRSAATGTRALGIRPDHLRLREHDADELSHYSRATTDVEYLFPFGWQELEGIANRSDFDLTAARRASPARSSSTWTPNARRELRRRT